MHTAAVTAAMLAVLASLIRAEELRTNDVPSACTTICGPIVSLTNTCDVDPEKRERARRMLHREAERDGGVAAAANEPEEAVEAQCICLNRSFDVRRIAALCTSCISQNGKNSTYMDKIMFQCSFASVTYAPEATTAVAGVVVKATKPAFTAPGAGTATGSGGAAAATSNTGKPNSAISAETRPVRFVLTAAALTVASLLH